MRTQIHNAHVLTPGGWIKDGSVIIEGSQIREICNNSRLVENVDKEIDAKGMHLIPGGVELHVHGGGGRDFMEGTEDAFRVAVNAHLQNGTTAIFPTLSSSTVPMI